MSFDFFRGYIARKDNKGSSYNYNLFEMINNFDFYDFFHATKNNKMDNNGATLVITNKQYILGYNAGFGMGTHYGAFARIYLELFGGGRISNEKDMQFASRMCYTNYLTARITYERVMDDDIMRPIYKGSINFSLSNIILSNDKSISPGMFKAFCEFYDDYNDEIKKLCDNYNFKVVFYHVNKKGSLMDESNSLDNLYHFLKSIVNNDKKIDDSDELIIGKPINKKSVK